MEAWLTPGVSCFFAEMKETQDTGKTANSDKTQNAAFLAFLPVCFAEQNTQAKTSPVRRLSTLNGHTYICLVLEP